MLRTKLFDGPPTVMQRLLLAGWFVNLGAVIVLWATTVIFTHDLSLILHNIGLLCGLLATFFALTQFLLMGRIAWIERWFGLDHLASYHRINGYLAISFILAHPIFITASHSLESSRNFLGEYVYSLTHDPYVWLAFIAELLFISVVASSIYIARKRLKFETWYTVHLMVYAAIVLVSFHQFAIGSSFVGGYHPLARNYWLGLYIFVAANLVVWRFALPLINLLYHDFRVEKVVAETPSTTSIYIRLQHLDQWRSMPGQFVLVRFLARGYVWQEHPFSLSWIPHHDQLRLTIRHVGDFTNTVAKLKPGTRVLVSGPFGKFTKTIAQTDKRLFIAGGVGITPIRSLAEEASQSGLDSVLVYANRSPNDVVFHQELSRLKSLRTVEVYSEPPAGFKGKQGFVTPTLLRQAVPDIIERDVYLCGPPAMMEIVLAQLQQLEVPSEQIHFERFALHVR